MKLFPLHDDQGALWPELDWRWVSSSMICQYEKRSVWLIYTRTIKHWYGQIGSTMVRRRQIAGGRVDRVMEYCPAAIWRAKRFGRYADPSFDPHTIQKRLWECDPAKTAERQTAQAPATLPADVSQALAAQAGALLQSMSMLRQMAPHLFPASNTSEPIAFHGQR